MNMNTRRGDEARIAEQAAEWISKLGDNPESRSAFFEWLKASPRHVEETLFVLALSKEASLLDKEQSDALMVDIASHSAVNVNVVTLPNAKVPIQITTGTRSFRARKWAGIAASGALFIAGVLWFVRSAPTWQQYSTKAGEQRALELDDGSIIQLNTRSSLKVRFSAKGRDLHLVEGEALFKVAQDTSRPFRVTTDDTVIQALGTQFNVYHRPGGTQVSVIEGLVQVSTTRLPAGEQLNVAKGRVTKRSSLDVATVTAWRQRRLVFQDDTLANIAAEFNRYNSRVSISVATEVESERFTGTFDADAPEVFMLALGGNRELRTERHGDEIVIRKNTAASAPPPETAAR